MTIAIVNHHLRVPTDLSLRVGGTFRRARVQPAGATSETGDAWSRPSVVYVEADHLAALVALAADDPRRLRLLGFVQVDMGAQPFSEAAKAALAAALAPAAVYAPPAQRIG